MSLFVRLSTVAVVAVLLRCVPATVDITAPSTVTTNTAGLETREQGPTAWICSALAVESPWTSYANIRGYLEGGNAENKDYSNLVLYPVMELFHTSESRLCVYLPAEDHCYPPAPSTNQVKVVKQLTKRNYYAIRFWGQASDARVQYYKQKLTEALNTQSRAAKFDLFFVSYFSDHIREVRFDPAPTAAGKSVVPSVESGSPTCPATSVYTMSGSPVQAAGREYHLATTPESRLDFSDVRIKDMNSTSMDACAAAASSEDRNAFSFVKNVCKLYTFGKDFCPCTSGDFEIYINKKLLRVNKDLGDNRVKPKDMKEMIIYLDVSWPTDFPSYRERNLDQCLNNIREYPYYNLVAIVKGEDCILTHLIDVANCNQPCRGNKPPLQAFMMKENSSPDVTGPPFLSLCGKNVSIPLAAGANSSVVHFFSHAGFGCYPYPEAKRDEDEDCLVNFENKSAVKELIIILEYVDLNRVTGACQDFISMHEGKIPDEAKNEKRLCNRTASIEFKDVLAVKFHRMKDNKGVRLNMGFVLSIQSNE